MVKQAAYQPERGDLVYLDFTPHAGTEQGGRRPALILSHQEFNIATGLAYACPITNKGKGSPFEVVLPKGAKLTGYALSDHARSVDWIARNAQFHSKTTTDFLCEVLGRIEAILGVDFG